MNLIQNQDNISIYFLKLKNFIDKLLTYESIPNYTCGGLRTIVGYQQRDWVIKFFMGLNES